MADATAGASQWASRTLPGYKKQPAGESQQAFLFCVARSSVPKNVGGGYPLTPIAINR